MALVSELGALLLSVLGLDRLVASCCAGLLPWVIAGFGTLPWRLVWTVARTRSSFPSALSFKWPSRTPSLPVTALFNSIMIFNWSSTSFCSTISSSSVMPAYFDKSPTAGKCSDLHNSWIKDIPGAINFCDCSAATKYTSRCMAFNFSGSIVFLSAIALTNSKQWFSTWYTVLASCR
jgi:hypothetical protein